MLTKISSEIPKARKERVLASKENGREYLDVLAGVIKKDLLELKAELLQVSLERDTPETKGYKVTTIAAEIAAIESLLKLLND